MAKESKLTSIIELPLGICLSGIPGKTALAWLDTVALECNRMRSAVQRKYLQWREDNPSWSVSKEEAKRRNKEIAETRALNKQRKIDGQEPLPLPEKISTLFGLEEKILYHWARSVATRVSSQIGSNIAQKAKSELTANVPYDHAFGKTNADGSRKLVCDALVNDEISRKTYRSFTIPCLRSTTLFAYQGYATGRANKAGSRSDVTGANCCYVDVVLWSTDSPFQQKSLRFRLNLKSREAGHRKILAKIAKGEIRMADSQLVKKDGQWYFQMAYNPEPKDYQLNPARTAVLVPGSGDSPFYIGFFDENGELFATRSIGNGRAYKMQLQRLTLRRRALQYRYRFGARKGRGRKSFFQKRNMETRSGLYLQAGFRKQAVAEIMKMVRVFDCGTMLYREPTKPVRVHSAIWFNQQDANFDYTIFLESLKHKMAAHRVDFSSDRIDMKHWKEMILEKSTEAGIALHGVRLLSGKTDSKAVSVVDTE